MRATIMAVVLATTVWFPATADEPQRDELKAELKKLQGLWQTFPGGMEHQNGSQAVCQPTLEATCFFVCGDRLIWLDAEGKPSGKEEKLKLDAKANPKRITLTPVGKDKDSKPTHGIYSATGSSLTIHVGIDGGPAPKDFLVLNKPVKGVDGSEWLVSRKKLQDK